MQEGTHSDSHHLAQFGYRQELHRTLGSFSSFAAGYSYISILTGMFQTSALGFFFGVDQRKFRTLVDRHVGAIGNLQQAQHVLRFFLDPLISADGSDAEHVKLLRLQKDEDSLLVAGSRAARVLIDDDFDVLG